VDHFGPPFFGPRSGSTRGGRNRVNEGSNVNGGHTSLTLAAGHPAVTLSRAGQFEMISRGTRAEVAVNRLAKDETEFAVGAGPEIALGKPKTKAGNIGPGEQRIFFTTEIQRIRGTSYKLRLSLASLGPCSASSRASPKSLSGQIRCWVKVLTAHVSCRGAA